MKYSYDFCGVLSENHAKSIEFLYISVNSYKRNADEEAHNPREGVDAG